MKVFLSHSSKDKPQVAELAAFLRANGIDAWLDQWEIAPGDDLVAKINDGLDRCAAGLIFLSGPANESPWVRAEVSYLVYARVQEGKTLIPVVVDDAAFVPPLLRPLIRVPISDHARVRDALLHRSAKPPLGVAVAGRTHRLTVRLDREGDKGMKVAARLDGEEIGAAAWPELTRGVAEGRQAFLENRISGHRRSPAEAAAKAADHALVALGHAVRELCFPGGAADALTALLDGVGRTVGTTIEVEFESASAEFVGLPFESLRLADGRLLVAQENVVVRRRVSGLPTVVAAPAHPLPGPLKILVAVGAPDEGRTSGAVLDTERELQNILDAVEEPRRRDDVAVRILEVGHPDTIADAFESDAYHVLHLSCHGAPGRLLLETEEGAEAPTTAAQLLKPIKASGRRLPLVFVSACHGGALEPKTMSSLARDLLAEGVEAVVAMQTSVSDAYATELAKAFYTHLGNSERPSPGRALAAARRDLEKARQKALAQGDAPLGALQPEYATPTLYVAAEESPVADYAAEKVALRARVQHTLSGPVPQLGVGDLIGRRRELRRTLGVLRGKVEGKVGVVLTGLGGVGKSALAGRAMRAMSESGAVVAAHVGRFSVGDIVTEVGAQMSKAPTRAARDVGATLLRDDLNDNARLTFLREALAEHALLLVLDDFEQNLTPEGAYRDPSVGVYLGLLLQHARSGRILITSRYPVPESDAYLERIELGALSPAETRKLLLRLPALMKEDAETVQRLLREVGGHPRILEFIDGLMQGGKGRLPAVTERLKKEMIAAGMGADGAARDLTTAQREALILGARTVVFDELLAIARKNGDDEAFLQLAVSNLPVPTEGLAQQLAAADAPPAAPSSVEDRLGRLSDLSLATVSEVGAAFVHRWIAEAARGASDPEAHRARCKRAGDYRWRRVETESHPLEDAVESARNFVGAQCWDAVNRAFLSVVAALKRASRTVDVAGFAAELLESTPFDCSSFGVLADQECHANVALGLNQRAIDRWVMLAKSYESRLSVSPGDASILRNYAVALNAIGNIHLALGRLAGADGFFRRSHAIIAKLVAAEPSRVALQLDLAYAYERHGEIARALGQSVAAIDALTKSLEIRERLAAADSRNPDIQRSLSVSLNKLGDTFRVSKQYEIARSYLARDLSIAEGLAAAEPERVEFQDDLATSLERVGELAADQGDVDGARSAYLRALGIRVRLVRAEPERADLRRRLAVPLAALGRFGEAYDVLRRLKDSGLLSPRDEGFLERMRVDAAGGGATEAASST